MISEHKTKLYCCEDISLIENYETAINSDELYVCHHINGIILNKKRNELKELGLYYNRPANELIFLTHSEHHRLHNLGENNPMYGKTFSDETIQKLSESKKGKHWKLENGKRVWY